VRATGLQTFPEFYENGIPLGTQSQWGWHSFPNPDNYTIENVTKYYTAEDGRKVPMPFGPMKEEALRRLIG